MNGPWTNEKPIRPLMRPTVAETLAVSIIKLTRVKQQQIVWEQSPSKRARMEYEWADDVLKACESAMRRQDEMIAYYQELEMERTMLNIQPTTYPRFHQRSELQILKADSIRRVEALIDEAKWDGPKPTRLDNDLAQWICADGPDSDHLRAIIQQVDPTLFDPVGDSGSKEKV